MIYINMICIIKLYHIQIVILLKYAINDIYNNILIE